MEKVTIMKRLFNWLFGNLGYIKLHYPNGEEVLVNIRSIQRYEYYKYGALNPYKSDSTINSRLYYLDGHYLNLKETPDQVEKLISEVLNN